jgi:hypothetical protein
VPINKNYSTFIPKFSPCSQKYGLGIRNLRFGIWKKPIPDPRDKKSTGSRIRNTEKLVPFAGTTPVTDISEQKQQVHTTKASSTVLERSTRYYLLF